jgi:DNA-binding beta-propeller fold protein YncE
MKYNSNGTLLSTWGRDTYRGGDGIATDSSKNPFANDVFVATASYYHSIYGYQNYYVYKYTFEGVYLTSFGGDDCKEDTNNNCNGKFYNPRGVAVDSNGYVYVVDQGNNRVQVFAPGL